ncbi:MAG: FtsX-like permease family protein, partial [Bacteroidota bacterium]
PGQLTSFALDIKRPERALEIANSLNADLPEDYEVMDWQAMMPDLVQMLEADKGGNAIPLAILYLVVGFGIFGTVLMMTAERKYEFGVLIGIGMKRSKLALTVLLETIFISLLGVVIGSLIAFPLTAYYHYNPIYLSGLEEAYAQFGFEPVLKASMNPEIFINQAIIVLIISCIISIYPALRIMKIDPVKAMHV